MLLPCCERIVFSRLCKHFCVSVHFIFSSRISFSSAAIPCYCCFRTTDVFIYFWLADTLHVFNYFWPAAMCFRWVYWMFLICCGLSCLVPLASILVLFLTQSHFWRSYLALVVSSTILLPQCFTVLVLVVSFSYLVRLFFLLVWVFSRFWGLMVVCVKV